MAQEPATSLTHPAAGPQDGGAPSSSPPAVCDVLVVGGGINGAGIARDLAGRGLRVVLCEQDDLASHTSSSSTKLIHGGLRYLEYYEFSLVRKALQEREGLLRGAPHIMWPLRFVMPHDASMRPVWMVRAGLFLYDHLARRELLPGSRTIDLRQHEAGRPLKPHFTKGFVYSDGWVDDARLVVLNAIDAAQRGASVFTRCRCTQVRRVDNGWQATLHHMNGGDHSLSARAVVNAAGPWAAQFLRQHAGLPDVRGLRLIKGSHIVVPKLFEHDHAYIFQNPDKRIIFAIPYERDFTLIGTTDIEHKGVIGQARIDADEISYLCDQASRYFARAIQPADVVWTYSGVRPLLDDASDNAAAVTRDYLLDLDHGPGDAAKAPLLNVWGGKITTFRKLAEEASDAVCAALNHRAGAWTRDAVLPGGDLSGRKAPSVSPQADIARFIEALRAAHPDWSARLCDRLAHGYGSRVSLMLDAQGSLGAEVVPGLHEGELRYLHDHEWARSPVDVLWRRTKLGLHLGADQREAVGRWWQAQFAADAIVETDPRDAANAEVVAPAPSQPGPASAIRQHA